MRFAVLALTSLILAWAGAFSAGSGDPSATVRGAASYWERIVVPPGTQLEVVLEDVSREDVPAKAEVAHGELGAIPATFTGVLPCADCEAIDYHLDLFADRSFYLRTTYRDLR